MMRAVLAVGLIFVAAAVNAQTVPVRSGEHDSFSRLVLSIPAGTGWQLMRDGPGYALTLDGAPDFDVSEVFDRLPRDRLAGLTEGAGTLRLDLACACHATAFLWRDDRLVIDVTDGPAPDDSPFEGPVIQPSALPRVAVLPLLTARAAAPATPLMPDPFLALQGGGARLAETGQALRESVARAASQGLLQIDPVVPAEPAAPLPNRAAAPQVETAEAPVALQPAIAVGPLQATAPPQTATPGISFATAIDLPRQDEQEPDIDSCLPDAMFDLTSWSESLDFATEIGRARAALGTEDGPPPPDAVEAMARVLIHFGFGREAAVTLGLDGRRSTEREILLTLARLVDDEPAEAAILAGQANCPGPGALWAALANGTIAQVDDPGRIAIETAHREMPPQMRANLAARLARLFLDAGDPATAEVLLNATEDAPDGASLGANLTAAEVTLVTHGAPAAIASLQELARSDHRMTPDALLRLMELARTGGQPVDGAVLELVEGMRYEARGTPVALALLAAEIRAHLTSQGFQAAFALIDEVAEPVLARVLIGETALAVAQGAADAAFVESAFGPLARDLPPDAGNAVAGRLLSLGFAEQALRILGTPAEGQAMGARRYLRAEAATALGRWVEADAALTGLTDPHAASLRADLLIAQGNFSGAVAVPGQPDDPLLAWRAGAWAALSAADDPLLTAASAARLATPAPVSADPADPAAPPPLAARAALLAESEATRALATTLLEQFADTGPILGGPVVAGPVVAGPVVAGPVVAGPVVAGIGG